MVAKSLKPGSACDAALFAADFLEYRGERENTIAECGEFQECQ
jgi:hypothetical protein